MANTRNTNDNSSMLTIGGVILAIIAVVALIVVFSGGDEEEEDTDTAATQAAVATEAVAAATEEAAAATEAAAPAATEAAAAATEEAAAPATAEAGAAATEAAAAATEETAPAAATEAAAAATEEAAAPAATEAAAAATEEAAAPAAATEAVAAATEAVEVAMAPATEEAAAAATEEAAAPAATEAVAAATEEVAMAAATEEVAMAATEEMAMATEVPMAATEAAATTGDSTIDTICLVTDIGRINDGTFNQYAYEGMIRAAEDFGLDSQYIETTAPTDYEANINTCLSEDYDIIVTVGFLLADATRAAAEANPNTYFIGVDQFLQDGPANYAGIQFREDQAGFLVGVLAGLVTQSNTVAGVYGIDIPPVVKFRNGYEQGLAYIAELEGKEITALGVYIDSFTDAARGASAAEQFIGEGADVIFGAGGGTGSGGILAAAQQDVYVIGVDQDEYFTTFGGGETPGAEFLISSALKRVDVGVYDLVQALVEGNMDNFFGGSIYVLSVSNGGIDIAEKHDADIDDALYERVAEVRELLVSGELETGVDPVTGALLSGEGAEAAATEEAAPAADATEAAAEATAEAAVEATAEATPGQ